MAQCLFSRHLSALVKFASLSLNSQTNWSHACCQEQFLADEIPPMCLVTVRKSAHECGSKPGQGSWQQLSCVYGHGKMFVFMLPWVWFTGRVVSWKSWSHWTKAAFFMIKEPGSQIKKNLKGDFEILTLSWPDETGQEDWVYRRGQPCDFTGNLSAMGQSPWRCFSFLLFLVEVDGTAFIIFLRKKTLQGRATQSYIEKGVAEPANKILPPKFQTRNMIYIGPPNKIQVTKV